MEILIILAIFSIAIGYWANNLGRNGWGWGIAALLVSPLIVGIVLLFTGKTLEKQAEEAHALQDMVKTLSETNKNS